MFHLAGGIDSWQKWRLKISRHTLFKKCNLYSTVPSPCQDMHCPDQRGIDHVDDESGEGNLTSCYTPQPDRLQDRPESNPPERRGRKSERERGEMIKWLFLLLSYFLCFLSHLFLIYFFSLTISFFSFFFL